MSLYTQSVRYVAILDSYGLHAKNVPDCVEMNRINKY